jgi:hypothetical protein
MSVTTAATTIRGLWFADNIVWSSLNLAIPLIGGSGEDGAGSLTWGLGATYISTVETPFNSPRCWWRSCEHPQFHCLRLLRIDLVTSLTYDAGFAKFGVQYLHYFYPDTYAGSFNGVANSPTATMSSASRALVKSVSPLPPSRLALPTSTLATTTTSKSVVPTPSSVLTTPSPSPIG